MRIDEDDGLRILPANSYQNRFFRMIRDRMPLPENATSIREVSLTCPSGKWFLLVSFFCRDGSTHSAAVASGESLRDLIKDFRWYRHLDIRGRKLKCPQEKLDLLLYVFGKCNEGTK